MTNSFKRSILQARNDAQLRPRTLVVVYTRPSSVHRTQHELTRIYGAFGVGTIRGFLARTSAFTLPNPRHPV